MIEDARAGDTHPRIFPDRGTLEDRLEAFGALYHWGAYLVPATEDKRPARNLMVPSACTDASGKVIYEASGKAKIKEKVAARVEWREIERHVRLGRPVLYYGPGRQHLAVLDCDPLTPDIYHRISQVLGDPAAWYWSSGNWKSERPAEGKPGGYGGHLVYRTNPVHATNNRSFSDRVGGEVLGELFSLSSHSPPDKVGYGFICWDPVALVRALRHGNLTNLSMLPTTGARGGGGGGGAGRGTRGGGRHDTLLDDCEMAILVCTDPDDRERLFEEAADKFRDSILEEGDASRIAGMDREIESAKKWARKKEEEMVAAVCPSDTADTERHTLARALLSGGRTSGKARRANLNRAYYMADKQCDPNPKRFKRGRSLTPRALAKIDRYRSDHLQRALLVLAAKNGWRLVWRKVQPFVKASITNGLYALVGADGIASDIRHAADFAYARRSEGLQKRAQRVRDKREALAEGE